jgi:anti-sigma factor RsiW
MSKKITNRDVETLSAYLDEQLTPRERIRLERRLRKDPELKNEIEQLRHTRQLIRNLPKVRAPHNFTLSPKMAGIRKTPRIYPVFRLASALATILFALVLVSDFFGSQQFTQAPQPEKALISTPAASVAAQEVSPESSLGGGTPKRQVIEGTENAMPLEAPSASGSPEASEEVSRLAVPGTTGQAPAAALAQNAVPELTPEKTEEAAADGLLEGATPIPTEEATAVPELSTTTIPETTSSTLTRGLTYRILEIVLVLIALITGLAAIITRRGTGA